MKIEPVFSFNLLKLIFSLVDCGHQLRNFDAIRHTV